METTSLLQLVTAISTTSIAISGVFCAYFWGYIPQKDKTNKQLLQKELLECYENIAGLLEIESDYMQEENIGKKKTRENVFLTKKVQPKHVQTRIEELTKILKIN